MKRTFYNRQRDLQDLTERHKKLSKGELIVIYGRRRVGKTELIKELLERIDNGSFYFYVDVMERPQLLESLSREISAQLGEGVRFGEWSDFLAYIHRKATKPFVLVIDEFQRFLDVSPDFLTTLQRYWDETLKHDKILIFLIGSSLGMMHRVLESKAGALYGRITGRIKLSPFNYAEFREVFPELNEEDKVRLYSVFGGTPQYFLLAKQYKGQIDKAIEELVLTKGRELEDEPERFLEYERVRVRAKYNAILQSIAAGKVTLTEIAEQTGIPKTALPAYLARVDTLLDLITRQNPVLGKERLGRYVLKDPFFTFWYRFVFPHRGALHFGNKEQILKFIRENLNAHTARIFESIVIELLIRHNGRKIHGKLIHFDTIGSWWDRSAHEIDILAHDATKHTMIIGEVKWTNEAMGTDVLDELLHKIKYVNFAGNYMALLVSKNGFTKQCLERIESIKGLALDLKDVAELMS